MLAAQPGRLLWSARAADPGAGLSAPRTNAAGMAAGGDSRSLFVVQRSFRRVRRGYDPEEVDRHLQLVSEWFSHGRAGRTARGLEEELRAREAQAEAALTEAQRRLEHARVEQRATLEGARLRAEAEVEEARREAERIVAEAREGAAPERASARAEAEAQAAVLRADRDRELEAYADRRRREADRVVEAARRERRGQP
jgi:DivIVA domain-containing protein